MAIFFLVTVISTDITAAPVLQMHVFENENVNNTLPKLKTYIFSNSSRSETPESKYPSQHKPKNVALGYKKATFYMRSGYRHDKLFWNIADLDGTPNVLSELTWENIDIATLNFGVSYELKPNWLVNFDVVYGRIFDGTVQDSDYNGNNRTLEFSRSNNQADEGDVYDISLSAAYQYHLSERITLLPELGISYHAQNLKAVDGYQTIPASGSFSGLNSTYDATWFGPWIGWNTLFKPNEKLTLNLALEYHHITYDSTADWNLRTDFAHPESFTHEANGYGWISRLEGSYKYSPRLTFDMSFNYQEWVANKNGEDITYFANGTVVRGIPLNEVKWRSYGFSLGLNYDF